MALTTPPRKATRLAAKFEKFFYTVTFRRQRYTEGSLVYEDWKMNTHAICAASDHEARRRLLDEYLERGCQVKEIAAELAGA